MLLSTVVPTDLDDDDDAIDVADVEVVSVHWKLNLLVGLLHLMFPLVFHWDFGHLIRILTSETAESVWFRMLLSSSSTGSVAGLVPNIPSMSS